MIEFRPVFYVIGLLLFGLGASMILPAIADAIAQNGHWSSFALSSFLTMMAGLSLLLTCREARASGLTIQQTFLLTTLTWSLLPVFAAIPFVLGEPGADVTDAFFEAVSGLTTTGSTVFEDLETMPRGTHLWRALLQWFGGIGIIVVAIAFLPMMKVGGMQYFRTEGFDTLGKILPRAAEIATNISWIYVGLTLICVLAYEAAGMSFFDSLIHALTTISTGGFSNYDDSFGAFSGAAEYVAVLFIILASLPFVRYVQLTRGSIMPLIRDSQIRDFLILAAGLVLALSAFRIWQQGLAWESTFRETLFNVVSILSGTGYASADYGQWGGFAVALFFLIGLVGGCTGSTTCSIKIFRFQIAFASLRTQIRQIQSPNGVFYPHYEGRRVGDDVVSSIMAFLVMFLITLAGTAIVLGLMGLDMITAVSGAASALANIGPGLGPEIGPAGNFGGLPDSAKWVLAFAMLLGRLELLAVYVLFTARFWRA